MKVLINTDAIGNLILNQTDGVKISWTPYGKIRTVQVRGDSIVMSFRYDATGNRVEKKVIRRDTVDNISITRYLRDASGNVMTIYQDTIVSEQPVYGSSRIGMNRGFRYNGERRLGNKQFELSNHLGNILTVITDNIFMEESDSIWAAVVSVSDYYPFGLEMKGRSWTDTTSTYRYGFNGKEKDDEIAGRGESYDFGARIYDSRIVRWLSLDPLAQEFPSYSDYNYVLNNPIIYVDPDGENPIIVITDQKTGYTHSRVYGRGKTDMIIVPTYKMIVYDVADDGTRKVMGTYNVTRDGWYNQGTQSSGSDLLVNRTTEPKSSEITVDATPTVDYGKTLGAYALKPVDAEPTPSSWNNYVDGRSVPDAVKRADPNTGTDVMIHIEGIYEYSAGGCGVGGTYGCFGVIDPSQVSNTIQEAHLKAKEARAVLNDPSHKTTPTSQNTSNMEQNNFVNSVNRAKAAASARGEKNANQIQVTIKKRSNVKNTHNTKP